MSLSSKRKVAWASGDKSNKESRNPGKEFLEIGNRQSTFGNSESGGHSSVGRAPALQAGSQGFESPCLQGFRIAETRSHVLVLTLRFSGIGNPKFLGL